MTSLLLDRERLIAVDLDPIHVRRLTQRYGHLENFSAATADLSDPELYVKLESEELDTVVCINVLEHLDEPEIAIHGFHRILRRGGAALVLVPAYPGLYSAMDEAIRHRRRYDGDDVRALLEQGGFTVERLWQFNRLGRLGWWVNRRIGRRSISRSQVLAFRLLMPLAKALERVDGLPGLSWVAVARKVA